MDEVELTPHEEVIAAYGQMAHEAKPYRPDPESEADRVVIRYDDMKALYDAIMALPSDLAPFPPGFTPDAAEEASGPPQGPYDRLAGEETSVRVVKEYPPIKPLPTGYKGITVWRALRLHADFFEEMAQRAHDLFGVDNNPAVQGDLRTWADELERRFS